MISPQREIDLRGQQVSFMTSVELMGFFLPPLSLFSFHLFSLTTFYAMEMEMLFLINPRNIQIKSYLSGRIEIEWMTLFG